MFHYRSLNESGFARAFGGAGGTRAPPMAAADTTVTTLVRNVHHWPLKRSKVDSMENTEDVLVGSSCTGIVDLKFIDPC